MPIRQPSHKQMNARYKRFTRELQADAQKERVQTMNTIYDVLNECDTAFAVFNMCGDTPQTRKAVRDAWAKVQTQMIALRPTSKYAKNVLEEPKSAYNIVKRKQSHAA